MKEVCERIETTRSKPVIFLVISFLIVMLIYSSSSSRFVQAVPVFGPTGEKNAQQTSLHFSPLGHAAGLTLTQTQKPTKSFAKYVHISQMVHMETVKQQKVQWHLRLNHRQQFHHPPNSHFLHHHRLHHLQMHYPHHQHRSNKQ